MQNPIAVNQDILGLQKENKTQQKTAKSSKSFAKKMKAAQKRKTKNDVVKAESTAGKREEKLTEKETKKRLEKTAAELLALLAEKDFKEINQQKVSSLFKKRGLLKADAALNSENIATSKLANTDLESLFADLETLLNSLEVDSAEKEQLSALFNLLQKTAEKPELLVENKLLREKFKAYFKVQSQNTVEAEPETSKKVDLKQNTQQLKSKQENFSFLSREEKQLSQKANPEAKIIFKGSHNKEKSKNTVQKTENTKGGKQQELKLFDSLKQGSNSELNLKFSSPAVKGVNSSKDKIIDFNFSGADSSPEAEINLDSRTVNSTFNNAEFKSKLTVKDQFIQKFKGQYSAAKNEMNIELKPEALGKIELKLNLDQGKLAAKMLVENKLVQAQLKNSIQEIKTELFKQGINIEQFKVETAKNAPSQVKDQNDFNFDQQNSAFSDGETGQNQEYEQRQFFQGQYYLQKRVTDSSLEPDAFIMRQQEIINRAAFSNSKLNLIV